MPTIVAYDIASSRRRSRIAKLMLSYGERVQYSVFECDLTPERLAELQERLVPMIRPKFDRVHFYPICANCFSRATALGRLGGPAANEL